MQRRPLVVIGLLGTTLDSGLSQRRWDRWRPTVALVQHEDLIVDRLELLFPRRFTSLADTITEDVTRCSPETTVRGTTLDIEDPWDLEETYGALHDFARAYPFDTEREDYLVHITTGTHISQICLFLLVEARYIPARLLQTSPAGRRGAEPGEYRVIDLDLSAYDRLASRFQREHTESQAVLKAGIRTRNAAFNRLIEEIERVAIASTDPLLLTGPTGAGKSQLARRIHALKHQRRQYKGRFVDVNCATLRGDAAMSALFGHVRGAFTGAADARSGLLRQADGGLLFLDEIGELGADEQAMLLRALEERSFYPMGSDTPVHSDFQLIAGTNRDLHAAARTGAFREDLLARIHLWTFRLPALRERPEDLEPNLDYELERCGASLGRHITMAREARARFVAFGTAPDAAWRGNFRDLSGAVRRMATLCLGGRIAVADVEAEIGRLRAQWGPATGRDEAHGGETLPVGRIESVLSPEQAAALDPFDRAQLAYVLRVCAGARSLSEAGRALFAESRQRRKTTNDADRLRKYLARFELSWREVGPEAGEETP